jgi:hypothetical protein
MRDTLTLEAIREDLTSVRKLIRVRKPETKEYDLDYYNARDLLIRLNNNLYTLPISGWLENEGTLDIDMALIDLIYFINNHKLKQLNEALYQTINLVDAISYRCATRFDSLTEV